MIRREETGRTIRRILHTRCSIQRASFTTRLRVQRASHHDESVGEKGGFGRRRQLLGSVVRDAERDESVQESEPYRHQHRQPLRRGERPDRVLPRFEPDVPGGQVRHDVPPRPPRAPPPPPHDLLGVVGLLVVVVAEPGGHGLVAHRREKPGPLTHLVLGRGEGVDLLELSYGFRVLSLRLERLAQEERGLGRGLGVGVRLRVQDG
mmetsp:Transcript_13937/g.60837  ORF Transcript_13937/g.60837 Transcript_13937/m.60837 type:complete len:206 (+) Transcript_13937:2959-3576(+)